MDKAGVVIPEEIALRLTQALTAECAPRVQHRSTGWQRWRGWCPGHRVGTPWGSQDDAQDWVLDHLQDNPEPVCECFDVASMEFGPNHPCAYCKDRNMA